MHEHHEIAYPRNSMNIPMKYPIKNHRMLSKIWLRHGIFELNYLSLIWYGINIIIPLFTSIIQSPGNELWNSDYFIGKSFFVWLLSLRDDEISFNIKRKSGWNFSGKWTAFL